MLILQKYPSNRCWRFIVFCNNLVGTKFKIIGLGSQDHVHWVRKSCRLWLSGFSYSEILKLLVFLWIILFFSTLLSAWICTGSRKCIYFLSMSHNDAPTTMSVGAQTGKPIQQARGARHKRKTHKQRHPIRREGWRQTEKHWLTDARLLVPRPCPPSALPSTPLGSHSGSRSWTSLWKPPHPELRPEVLGGSLCLHPPPTVPCRPHHIYYIYTHIWISIY